MNYTDLLNENKELKREINSLKLELINLKRENKYLISLQDKIEEDKIKEDTTVDDEIVFKSRLNEISLKKAKENVNNYYKDNK